MNNKTINSKTWGIRTAEGKKIEFLPIFEVYENPNEEMKDVECKAIQLKIDDKKYTFNFINIFQFIYFICNEELRMSLAQRYERRVNRIPYDVTFKLSDQEIKDKMCKRRIELPLDEVSVAYAKQEGLKYFIKNKLKFQK